MVNKSNPSDKFICRLIEYYKTHTESSCLPIWTGTYSSLREFLSKEDVSSIRNKLDTIYIDDLWGLDYNQQNSWKLPPYEHCFNMCIDRMAAELKFYNESNEKTVETLETITGVQFDIPVYPNRPVIRVGNRNIPLRFAVCYYVFYCITQNLKIEPNKVLEIGAGTGYFPYLFTQKYPNLKYNIIDLPIISVIQSYIYSTMVSENNIWFHGEPSNEQSNLHIYSPDSIDEIETGVDVAVNHNSFPEMPQEVQSKYLNKMRQLFTKDGFFYSLNWEPIGIDQTPVYIACDKNNFVNLHRREFPIESYVHDPPQTIKFFEEIYKPNE